MGGMDAIIAEFLAESVENLDQRVLLKDVAKGVIFFVVGIYLDAE